MIKPNHLLSLAIAAGLALSPWQSLPAKSPRAAATQADAEGRSTWIVVFAEPAIASFRGGKPSTDASSSLAATTPAVTGASKFDINAPASRAYAAYLADMRSERLTRAEVEFGRPLKPDFVYDAVLNGVSLELTADEAARMAKMPGVSKLLPNWVSKPLTDAGPRWIKADQVWSGAAGVQSRGEGVVVGVIDTGVNASHPMFAATSGGVPISNPRGSGNFLGSLCAGGSPCNNKLIGVYDFTTGGGDNEPNNGLDVDGHGSHTASTAVGNPMAGTIDGPSGAVAVTFTGVAPRANLVTYKACEMESDCSGVWTLAAINRAVADGVDVINYSIGGGARNPWADGDAIAFRGAYDAGIVVVVSAGNDGPNPGTVGSPANAPWVLTAAAATHTRAIINDLELSGGVGPLPGGGVLRGAGNTGTASSTGVFDLLRPSDFPLCGQGTNAEGAVPNGASKPPSWTSTRFTATQMVLCERGFYARVAKSNNVRLAGGGAMVLLNQPENGASVNSDPHSRPAVHLSSVDADALRAWVALGGNPKGRLTGSKLADDPSRADILADFSSRGPNPGGTVDIEAVLKPGLTAPGVSILAATATGTGVANLSGTSMSSPHIAGAAALIIGARSSQLSNKGPARVEQVVGALMTTARPSASDFDGVTPANPFQQGSGVVDLSAAVKAGLYFPIAAPAPDFQSFTSANPVLANGDPRKLNLPALVEPNCFETCQLKRRVVAYGAGGAWRVEVDTPSGLQVDVSPATFTLNAGAGQTLTVSITVTDASIAGDWVHGAVRLVRDTADSVAEARLPLSVKASIGNVPAAVTVQAADDAGFVDIPADGLLAMPNAGFLGTALAPATTTNVVMAEDPTNDNPYDDLNAGVIWRLVQVPPGPNGAPRTYRLLVDLNSSTANDMDLFIGQDGNANGGPGSDEELCASTSAGAAETCEVLIEHPGGSQNLVYWWLAQSWAASRDDLGNKQIDSARVDAFLLPLDPVAGGLVATGPGQLDRLAPFTLRAAWNDPTFKAGQKRLAYAYIAPGGVPIGAVPVILDRGASPSAARALANGVDMPIAVGPGESMERIFFDVPPNAREVRFTSVGGNGFVDIYAAPAPAPTGNSTSITAAPPRSAAPFSALGGSTSKTITISGAALTPGRWYLTPVGRQANNLGPQSVTLKATITQADPRPALRSGHYFDSRRIGSSSGLFLDFAGDQWFAVWYAYLEDGTPTWYFGQGDAPSQSDATQTFRGNLLRVVWNGNTSSNVKVGEMLVTPTGPEAFDFSFIVDGKTGSEPMTRLGAGGCLNVGGTDLDVSGHWFSPSKSGFGYSVQLEAGSNQEIFAAYLYDAQGFPRWLFGQKQPFDAGTAINLWQFNAGACPTCAFAATPAPPIVGTLSRNYASNNITDMGVSASLAPPLNGLWAEALPVIPLSDRKLCQ